jgi:hypothetical protein
MKVRLAMIDEGRMKVGNLSKVVMVEFISSFDRQRILNRIAKNDYNPLPASLSFGSPRVVLKTIGKWCKKCRRTNDLDDDYTCVGCLCGVIGSRKIKCPPEFIRFKGKIEKLTTCPKCHRKEVVDKDGHCHACLASVTKRKVK